MALVDEGILSRARRKNPKAEMPFLDHLEELRWRILWSMLAVGVGTVVGLVVVHYFNVMNLLVEPGQRVFGDEWQLIYLAPTDAFFVFLKVGITVGVILASPIIIYQVWSFLSPALDKHEKRAIVPALYMGLVLFGTGVAMAYYIALPISLRFLIGFLTEFMEPTLAATPYMAFVVKLLLGFGIVFELPVVVLILSALGLVTPEFLRSKRRHAIVIITILASFLSPGDVVAVTVLMMVPLIFLYEFSILLSVLMWRKRKRRERSIESAEPPEGSVATTGATTAAASVATTAAAETDSGEVSPYTYGDPARSGDQASAPAGDEEE